MTRKSEDGKTYERKAKLKERTGKNEKAEEEDDDG